MVKVISSKIKKIWDGIFSTTYQISFGYRSVLVFVYSVFVFAFLSATSGKSVISAAGGDESLINNITKLIQKVYGTIVALSSAAAGIGVGCGVFMKKFSMGKQDKIELGNKLVKDSIIGWFTINSIGFILKFLANYTSADISDLDNSTN